MVCQFDTQLNGSTSCLWWRLFGSLWHIVLERRPGSPMAWGREVGGKLCQRKHIGALLSGALSRAEVQNDSARWRNACVLCIACGIFQRNDSVLLRCVTVRWSVEERKHARLLFMPSKFDVDPGHDMTQCRSSPWFGAGLKSPILSLPNYFGLLFIVRVFIICKLLIAASDKRSIQLLYGAEDPMSACRRYRWFTVHTDNTKLASCFQPLPSWP